MAHCNMAMRHSVENIPGKKAGRGNSFPHVPRRLIASSPPPGEASMAFLAEKKTSSFIFG
jgi:hypothetical protein